MSATLAGHLRMRAHAIRMLGPGTLLWFVVLWTGLVTWLSAQPSKGDGSSAFAAHLLFNSGHAPLFGFWCAGVAFWLSAQTPRPVPGRGTMWIAILATVAFGALDEWHQSHVPGRTTSWTDICTDLVGAAVAMLCISYVASARATTRGVIFCVLFGIIVMIGAGALATTVDEIMG